MAFGKRLYYKIVRTLKDVAFVSGMGSIAINNPLRNMVVMYHGVDTSGKNLFNGRHTPIKYFEKQVQFLSKNYTVVSLKDYFERNSSENNLCAITFDDGYLNNLTNALPILEKYNTPATFFITGMNEIGCDILWADYVNIVSKICQEKVAIDGETFYNKNGNYFSEARGTSLMEVVKNEKPEYSFKEKIFVAFDNKLKFKGNPNYFEYWKLMSDTQLQVLSKSNCAVIGSHGYYHNNLGNISPQNAFDELSNSKKYLESLIQKEITSIGYPDGSYSDAVSDFATSIGIIHQTCSERFNKEEDRSNRYLKNRAGIYNFDSAANQLYSALNVAL